MKKVFLAFSLVLSVCFGGTTIVSAQTVQATPGVEGIISSKDKLNIDSIIKKYFESNLQSIKQKKVVDLLQENVSNEFKDYNNLNNKYFSDWYRKIDKSLNNYHIDIKDNNITFENNKYYIDSTIKTEMVFNDSLDIKQVSIDDYNIVISNTNNNFRLENVTLRENNIKSYVTQNSFSDISTKYKELSEKYANMDGDINLLKNTLVKQQKTNTSASTLASGGQYDFLAAVSYAKKWATSYNPFYRNWGNNDCTNFVSQCVVAGGKYMVEPTWAYSTFTQSRSWIVVDDFRNAMLNLGYGVAYNSIHYNGRVGRGDIIQFRRASDGEWSHSAIITSMDSYGTIYYSAHSSFRLDYGLYNVYPSATYNDIRFISIR